MKYELTIDHLKGTFVEGAILVEWLKEDGDSVTYGTPIAIVETRKKTVTLSAIATGILHHTREEWDRLSMDDSIGFILGTDETNHQPPLQKSDEDGSVCSVPRP
jgi:pyruvate/2-oxoglutarate dehydrogenase complex dihydrolipoamide acyltransferase (E2) component